MNGDIFSIDTVWDVLGGSIQIIIGFIIPCTSYLLLTWPNEPTPEAKSSDVSVGDGHSGNNGLSLRPNLRDASYRVTAWILLIVSIPVMFVCTSNAIYNIFNSD